MLAVAHAGQYLGVQRELGNHPTRGREQVRHRPEVHEDHVAGDADAARRLGLAVPTFHDPCEQIVGPFHCRLRVPRRDRFREEFLDLCHRGALGLFAARGNGAHRFGMHERSRAVELVESGHQLVEASSAGRCFTAPARKAHAMPEAAREREHVDGARVAHLREGDVYGCVQLLEVCAHVVAAE